MKKSTKNNIRAFIKYSLIAGATIGSYMLLHNIATTERGYEAVGGEIMVLLVYFLYKAIKSTYKDTKEALNR